MVEELMITNLKLLRKKARKRGYFELEKQASDLLRAYEKFCQEYPLHKDRMIKELIKKGISKEGAHKMLPEKPPELVRLQSIGKFTRLPGCDELLKNSHTVSDWIDKCMREDRKFEIDSELNRKS